MENAFFDFVETYWEDIAEFLKTFASWIEALIGKFNAE